MAKKSHNLFKYQKYVSHRYDMRRRRRDTPQLHIPDYRYAQPLSNSVNQFYRVPPSTTPPNPSSSGVSNNPEIFPVAPPTPSPEVALGNATDEQMVEVNELCVHMYLERCRLLRCERNNPFNAEWIAMKTAVYNTLNREDKICYQLKAFRQLFLNGETGENNNG